MLSLYDLDGFEEAARLFREALDADGDNAQAHGLLAETCSYWAFRLELNGSDSRSHYLMAYENALRAMALAPRSGIGHRAMSAALRGGPRADPELRRYEACCALELDPYDGETCYEYWRAFGYALDDGAVYKALAINPALCAVNHDLGVAFCKEGLLDEAVYHLEEALKINPRHSLGHYNLGMVLLLKGQAEEALEVLSRALAMHPRDPLIQSGLEILGAWRDGEGAVPRL